MNALILSLFPGVDLLGHAFEDVWPECCVVRGPDLIFGSLSDIRCFHPPAGKFDGIIGGPPCQSFSNLAHLVRANGNVPIFGNLIPEYERCVLEAKPAWFVMENVPQAPEPAISGYGVRSFLLDNSSLDRGDGHGYEQRRVRRFSFGLRDLSCRCISCARGGQPNNGPCCVPDLRRWIDLATFLLPDAEATITGGGELPSARNKARKNALTAGGGGNGSQRQTPGAGNGGKGRYRLADALRLQGLSEDFLEHAPFTAAAKLKAVANGVPLPMGRAIARAVKEAIGGTTPVRPPDAALVAVPPSAP